MFNTHVHESQAKQIMAVVGEKEHAYMCTSASVRGERAGRMVRRSWSMNVNAGKNGEQQISRLTKTRGRSRRWMSAVRLRCMCACGCAGGRQQSCQPATSPSRLVSTLYSVNHRGRTDRFTCQTCWHHFFKTSQNIPSWSLTTSLNAHTLMDMIWTGGWYCFRGKITDILHAVA